MLRISFDYNKVVDDIEKDYYLNKKKTVNMIQVLE